MHNPLRRRTFLATLAAVPFLGTMGNAKGVTAATQKNAGKKQILKTSLNAFSFNDHLLKGNMTLEDLLRFCADAGFSGIDITGYYFKGYPAAPAEEYLFGIKRKAFELGLEISGTGVRNDFTIADQTKRQAEVDLVKKWVEVAAKVGAPVLRIFSGTQKNEGVAKEKVREWMIKDIQTCVDYGKQHGVIIGLQNHNDFIQTADELTSIIKEINSPWLGIILDTGSYRVHDPYEEISKSIQYAVNWQIKEKIFIKGTEVETDLPKLMGIIKASAYNGYLPIETLGAGDPKIKILTLLDKLKQAMA